MNRTLLKLEGRETVRGERKRSLMFTFARVFISVTVGNISGFTVSLLSENPNFKVPGLLTVITFSVLGYIALSVFRMWEESWHISLSSDRKTTFVRLLLLTDVKKCLKAVKINLSVGIRKLLWFFALSFPGLVIIYFSFESVRSSGESDIFILMLSGGILSTVIGLFFAFCINQRYFMTKYLFARNPKMSVRKAVRVGIVMMDGNCWKTVIFKLSFLPLVFSCIFILPCIYVQPYLKQSCICMKREISALFFSQIKRERK